MEICTCPCGCKNEFKQNASLEMAVTMASHKPYKQTLCNDCIEDEHNEQDFTSSNDEAPITILKKRLASGEISKEEYEDLKSTLE